MNAKTWPVSSLEYLAYRSGTDKSKDDHKYVDVYAALFDSIRDSVRNVTEIGVSAGQSIDMWQAYFHQAHVWGIDHKIHPNVRARFRNQTRVRLVLANAYRSTLSELAFANSSMDIVIDDALHDVRRIEKNLETFFPLVKPGGFYIIEDIEWDRRTNQIHLLNPRADEPLSRSTTEILEQHAAFFVDSLFGHRNFPKWKRASGHLTQDRERHNSHLAVIRRRDDTVNPMWSFRMNLGKVAMKVGRV